MTRKIRDAGNLVLPAILLGLLVFWGLLGIAVALVPGYDLSLAMGSHRTAFLASLVLGVFAHELVHWLGYVVWGNTSVADVSFGFHWRSLTPFVHIRRAIKRNTYCKNLLSPLLFIGLLPLLAGVVLQSSFLVSWSIVMISGCSGDLLLYTTARRLPRTARIRDRADRIGYTIEEPECFG